MNHMPLGIVLALGIVACLVGVHILLPVVTRALG
jgi:hypothetical protein